MYHLPFMLGYFTLCLLLSRIWKYSNWNWSISLTAKCFCLLSCIQCSTLTLSQTSPGFYVSAVHVFWKHYGKRKKLLITSNFSFFPSVFYPFEEFSAIFNKFEIVVCKLFQFETVWNLSFGKGWMIMYLAGCGIEPCIWAMLFERFNPFLNNRFLTHPNWKMLHMTVWNFMKIMQSSSENTVGKGNIAQYWAISPFFQCFQKTCTV